MSHFTKIKTKLYNLETLKKSLTDLNFSWLAGESKVRGYQGQTHSAELLIQQENNHDIGFKWNGETYDLIADKQTWSLDVPVERFIDKVTQQYARATIHDAIKQQGLAVTEEWEMDDNSIEVLVTRWD